MNTPPEGARTEEYWLYFESPFNSDPRLSLGIHPSTGILEFVSWDVREGEAEKVFVGVRTR